MSTERAPRPPAPAAAAPRRRARTLAVAVLGLSSLGLASCAAGPGADGGDHDGLSIVASTTVYADVAEQVAGGAAEVTPVIDSPSQDPHSYEAAPADRLAVRDADLIVMNGGGYDSFMEDLIADSDVPVIEAVAVSDLEGAEEAAEAGHSHEDHAGHDHHGEFNEHVWYDLGTVAAVADAVSEELGELDPQGAEDYDRGAEQLGGQLDELGARVDGIDAHGDFLATEPAADHLLERAGLHDVTPEDLTAAVESGSDVPALTFAEVEDVVSGGDLDLLAYNEHTAGGQTQRLRTAAQEAGVPVLPFTETMPEGRTYVEWMGSMIDGIEQAL